MVDNLNKGQFSVLLNEVDHSNSKHKTVWLSDGPGNWISTLTRSFNNLSFI